MAVVTYIRRNGAWVTTGGGAGTGTALGLPVLSKTASFTYAPTDDQAILECDSASAMTVTLPPIGSNPTLSATAMSEISQVGAGAVTIVGAAGVNVRTANAGTKLRARYSSASVRRRPSAVPSLSITNLVARWRADDLSGADLSVVPSWAESSGTGLPAAAQATTANQPKLRIGSNGINGHNAVEFDGASDFLSLSGAALNLARNRSNLVVFVAFQDPSATVTTGPRTLFALSNGLSAVNARLSIMSHNPPGAGGLVPQIGGRILDADGNTVVVGTTPISASQRVTLTGVWRYSLADALLYQDGTQIASNLAWHTAGPTSDTASLAGAIGANPNGSGEWFTGKIAEILVYNTADTDGSLRANVDTYFYNQYAGTSPADYAGVSDEWVVTGDTTA